MGPGAQSEYRWENTLVVACGAYDYVYYFRMDTGSIVLQLPLGSWGNDLVRCRFRGSPTFAVGTGDGKLKFIENNHREKIHRVIEDATIQCHSSDVRAVLSCGDNRMATASDDKTVRIWNTAEKREVACLGGHEAQVCRLTNCRRGLVSCSLDSTVRVWDIEQGRCVPGGIIRGQTGAINAVTRTLAGIVCGSSDKTIKVYSLDGFECVRTFWCAASCTSLCAHPREHNVLYSGHSDGRVMMWDVRRQERCLKHAMIHSAAVHQFHHFNGDLFGSCSRDSTVKLWEGRYLTVEKRIDQGLEVTFSEDGERVQLPYSQMTTDCFNFGISSSMAGERRVGSSIRLGSWPPLQEDVPGIRRPPPPPPAAAAAAAVDRPPAAAAVEPHPPPADPGVEEEEGEVVPAAVLPTIVSDDIVFGASLTVGAVVDAQEDPHRDLREFLGRVRMEEYTDALVAAEVRFDDLPLLLEEEAELARLFPMPIPRRRIVGHIRQHFLVGAAAPRGQQPQQAGEDQPDWLLNKNLVEVGEFLAPGSTGAVFSGWYRAGVRRLKVALKRIPLRGPLTRPVVEREVRSMVGLDHSAVLGVYGCFFQESPAGHTEGVIVLRFCSRGNLRQYLEDDTSLADRMRLLISIAEGVKYLHEQTMVHRDLKPENILITRDKLAKISDFGTSRHLDTIGATFTGTVGYLPDPATTPLGDRTMIDVYAFAVIAWEVITKRRAYSDLREAHPDHAETWYVAEIHREVLRPEVREMQGVSDRVSEAIVRCWDRDPRRRLSFEQLIAVLRGWQP